VTKKPSGAKTLEAILKLKHALPFTPFELRLSDGRRFVITKGERLGRTPSGRLISFYAQGEPGHWMVNVEDVVAANPVRKKSGSRPRSAR
jgi:hypothetical protein